MGNELCPVAAIVAFVAHRARDNDTKRKTAGDFGNPRVERIKDDTTITPIIVLYRLYVLITLHIFLPSPNP